MKCNLYVEATSLSTFEDGTQGHPFTCLQKALAVVQAGCVVHVGPGTFRGMVQIKAAGVVLRGSGPDLTRIVGKTKAALGVGYPSFSGPAGTIHVLADDVVIEALATFGGYMVGIDGVGKRLLIRDVHVTGVDPRPFHARNPGHASVSAPSVRNQPPSSARQRGRPAGDSRSDEKRGEVPKSWSGSAAKAPNQRSPVGAGSPPLRHKQHRHRPRSQNRALSGGPRRAGENACSCPKSAATSRHGGHRGPPSAIRRGVDSHGWPCRAASARSYGQS